MNTADMIIDVCGLTFIILIVSVFLAFFWEFIQKKPKLFISFFSYICCFFVIGYVIYELNRDIANITVTEWNNGWELTECIPSVWANEDKDFKYTCKDEILADGKCVERTQAIINILKRKYIGYDRIRVADSPIHVQAVRLNDNGSIDFLMLDYKTDVIIGYNEFEHFDGKFRLIDPEVFLEAIDIYKPTITEGQLNSYLIKSNKG